VLLRRRIRAALPVVVLLRNSLRTEEVAQQTKQTPPVVVVGYTASVDHLARDVLEVAEGNVLRVVGKETLQLKDGHLEVGAVEFVGQVPAERAELLALVDESVDEAEAEEEALPVGAVVVGVVDVGVDEAARTEVLLEVVLEAARGLDGHLDAGLEQRDGKGGVRFGAEEETELPVDFDASTCQARGF